MIQVKLTISGKVQGVGYRASFLHETAKFPHIVGWVRNLPDGKVEACLQGREADIQSIVEWSRRGPAHGRVDHVEVSNEALDLSLVRFEIRR